MPSARGWQSRTAVKNRAPDGDSLRERLTAARRALGKTRREMAVLLMTPYPTYRQWECGERRTPGVAVVAAELLASGAPLLHQVIRLADGTRTAAEIAHETGAAPPSVYASISLARARGYAVPVARARRSSPVFDGVISMADGSRTTEEIAAALNCSPLTVKQYIHRARARGLAVRLLTPAEGNGDDP